MVTASGVGVTAAETAPVMLQLYVSASGSDSNDGSESKPFATLERAKQEVRKYNKDMTGDIIVNVAPGTYYLDSSLKLGVEDSASGGYSVIYKGANAENTILSGGKALTNWKLHDSAKNIWVADAPGVKSRQLFVNGERRSRASTTNVPALSDAEEPGNYYVMGNNIFTGIQNITEVEIVWKHSFSDYRMPVNALENGNKLIMPDVNRQYGKSASEGSIMRVENAYEWLDTPGEWYLNTPMGKVYYMPKAGEDVNKENIVIANLERVFDIEGTEQNHVKGITITGFTIKDTTWMTPGDLDYGYANFQAGFCREFDTYYGDNDYYNTDAAVTVIFADDIHLERCILKNIGGAGAWMRKGVRDSGIEGNIVYDISQNGLMLGNTFVWYAEDEKYMCDNVKVENNIVHDAGIEYWGCVGIFAGSPSNSSVSHNEVYNIPYTCISFGWGWLNEWPKEPEKNDVEPLLNVNNKIIGNWVHDGMTDLRDGGGIYTLGTTPGLLVAENVVSDMGRNECFAYYLDNGTRWATVRDNVSVGVDVVLYSKGADNKIYNNYFDPGFENSGVIGNQATGHSEYGQLPLPEGHQNQIYDNTVVKDGRFPNYIMMNAGLEYSYQDLKGLTGNEDENIAKKPGASAYAVKSNGKSGKFMTGKAYSAATDGNPDTEMRASGNDMWTADIDLGEKRSLKKLRILFGSMVPTAAKLSVSENGKDYTEIPFEIRQDNEIVPESRIVARNIQLQVTDGQMSIAELEVYADDFIPSLSSADRLAGLKLVTFDDIKEHWAKTSIEYLASLGIIKGDSDIAFSPDRGISRAEWIALVTRVLGIQKTPYLGKYSDVLKTDWYADNIQAALDSGLMDKCFGTNTLIPASEITRAEAAATLGTVKFKERETGLTASDFEDLSGNEYVGEIEYALNCGIMTGESEAYFNPGGGLTRAQAAVMLERVLLNTEK